MLFEVLKRWDELSGGKRLGPSVPVTLYHANASVDMTDVSRQAARTSFCDWRTPCSTPVTSAVPLPHRSLSRRPWRRCTYGLRVFPRCIDAASGGWNWPADDPAQCSSPEPRNITRPRRTIHQLPEKGGLATKLGLKSGRVKPTMGKDTLPRLRSNRRNKCTQQARYRR